MKYIFLIAGIFFGDERVKNYVEKNRKVNEKTEIAGGRIIITRHHNKGAVLNFMEEKPAFVAGAACIAFSYVIILLRQMFLQGENGVTKLGAAMIAGGGLSNLYDRIKRGYVVDYFIINYGKLKKVIFNFSDVCIFAGGFFMVLGELLLKRGNKEILYLIKGEM